MQLQFGTPFFERLGFTGHPFSKTNADEEPLLKSYFIPPPFFDAVVGDPEHPNSSIVLAPRGAGKTALRRMIEDWGDENHVLAVTYDRFEFGAAQKLDDVSLAYHLRNIIVRILVAYLSLLAEDPELLNELDRTMKRTLSLFVHSYLGDMTGMKFSEVLSSLRSVPEKIREFWSKNVGFLEPLINVLLKRYGLETIDLPDLKQEQKKLETSYKHQLEQLLTITKEAGKRSIYILIDKIDESEKTGGSPERTYRMLQPIVQDLELLGLNGYGFKIFAWDKIEELFRRHARPDRVPQYSLSWPRQRIEELIAARVKAFSGGHLARFGDIMQEKKENSDSIIALFANHSPRNAIRICEQILAVQADLDNTAKTISAVAFDRGITAFADQLTIELYGTDICQDLKRAGRGLFTINYLASSVFKVTHENTSRNKVTAWQSCGVVRQVGIVAVPESRRPLNFYYVADPCMQRAIHEAEPLDTFLKNRWIECSSCGKDNLIDILLVPKDNEPVCAFCSRSLF
jgi:hypothetical protein